MATAEEDAALAASGSGRRRGGRKLSWWGTVLSCFGSRGGEEALAAGTPCAGPRRRKRTVPVDGAGDGELVPGPAEREMGRGTDEEESRELEGPRLQGCCFLPPARAAGRKVPSAAAESSRSSSHNKQRQLEHTKKQPARPQDDKIAPSEAPSARQCQATAGNNGCRSRRAAQPRAAPTTATRGTPLATPRDGARSSENEASASESRKKASAAGGHGEKAVGVGAFGPAVGLSVVAAVSMAGLLGGRLWAVACVCACLAALSRLRRRVEPVAAAAGTAGGDGVEEAVVVDVDSTDHKKLVVLRGLLERDRTKAVKA